MKTLCPTDVVVGKFLIDAAHQSGNMPNTKVLDESLENNEAWYQTAKHLIDYPALIKDTSQFISNFVHRPSEILADVSGGQLVDDILNEYEATVENFYDEEQAQNFNRYISKALEYDFKNKKFKDGSEYAKYNKDLSYLEAVNPQKAQYFHNWMSFLHNPPKSNSWVAKGARTIRENLLKNSLSSAIMNATQLTQTIIPNADFQDVVSGVKMFIEDRENGFKELTEMGIGERTHMEELKKQDELKDKLIKFDVFTLMEKPNQGLAYFIGKAEGMRKNPEISDSTAKEYGKKKNEEWNFIPRLGNIPQNYWNESGRDALTLMSYTLQFNKMYAGWWKNAAFGKGEARGKAIKSLATYTILNTLLFGVEGAVSAPIWALFGLSPEGEELRENLKQLGKFSLTQGLLNLDLSGGLQPLNLKLGSVFFDSLSKLQDSFAGMGKSFEVLGEDGIDAWSNPKFYKGIVKAIRAGAIVTPIKYFPALDKTNIGGGQLGELADFAYRILGEDYERQDYTTKQKYETNAWEEFVRLLGKSRSESEKAYNID